MWSKGTIGVPQKDGSYIACKYWVKHYEEGSEWGIDEGRISKLEIRINGKITANYDRAGTSSRKMKPPRPPLQSC